VGNILLWIYSSDFPSLSSRATRQLKAQERCSALERGEQPEGVSQEGGLHSTGQPAGTWWGEKSSRGGGNLDKVVNTLCSDILRTAWPPTRSAWAGKPHAVIAPVGKHQAHLITGISTRSHFLRQLLTSFVLSFFFPFS
jgi:hypothetical protein